MTKKNEESKIRNIEEITVKGTVEVLEMEGTHMIEMMTMMKVEVRKPEITGTARGVVVTEGTIKAEV